MLISDIVPGVRRKLRGRDDLDAVIPFYIKSAILDLTENYQFEELRVTGPLTSFTVNQSDYPKSGSLCPFLRPEDSKLTFVVTWYVYYNTLPITVGQSTGMEMKGRTPRVVEPTSKISGIPTYYCTIGGLLVVGYLPNIAYATQMRYQRQHPFNPDSQLDNSQVYMPDDWQEIIEYAAAEKGCDDVGMNDIGILYHQKLYGNPQKKTVGIIMERWSQQERNLNYNETQLRPVVKRYTR